MADPTPDPGWAPDEVKAWREHLAALELEELVAPARQALALNAAIREDMATFLALGATPTAVQVRDQVRTISQRVSQMTQEFDGLIRLMRHYVTGLDEVFEEESS